MATYLQGVTDYIPQFQPFQPDLNFYANALQTKQTQYDSNYKALNNVYGQYFYADLTHGDNVKKKDELLKAIDFNLKRVSGLDLSLDQNVEQAKQVFKPFYDDKHLMKDMAWTKNTNKQRSYAAGLKNARDEEMRAQYWDAGIKSIDYKTDEFKNASLEETMNIGNVNYTPYVNVMEKAQKIAKDAGLSVETVDMSPDGKWIVKTKNGEQLMPKLAHLFEATLGSDPAVMDVYTTQAYVNRKDYSYSNAAQFGGDKNAAEMKYLSDSYKMLKAENENRQAKLEKVNGVYTKKQKIIEKAIENNEATPETGSFLERLQQAKQINSQLLAATENHVKALSDKSGTATTTTGFENPYGDIESLRYKVDNAMASKLMQKDLYEAANVFAYKDAKQDIDANPYAVKAQEHAYRMQEVASANAGRERAARIKSQSDKEVNIDNELYKSGAYRPDMNKFVTTPDGQQVPNPNYGRPVVNEEANEYSTRQKARGNITDKIDLREYVASQSDTYIDKNVVPYLKNMLVTLKDLKGQLTKADMHRIFGYEGMTVDEFNKQLDANPYQFIKGTLGTTKLKRITMGFQSVIKQNYNKGNAAFTEAGQKMNKYNNSLQDYYMYTKDLEKWKNETRATVISYVSKSVAPENRNYVKDMYDDKGNILSEAAFNKKINFVATPYREGSFTIDADGIRDYQQPLVSSKKSPYKELKQALNDGYKYAPIKKTPPGLSAYGEVKDSGLATIGEHGVLVFPDAPNTVGSIDWNAFKKDFNRLDIEKDAQIKFLGPTASAPNRIVEGKALIDAMFSETSIPGSTLKGFRLAAQPLAMNKLGKGAMIVYPDAEWLKKHTYTESGSGESYKKGPGIVSPALANYISTYGISVISDSKNWQNGLFQASYVTPLEASVNYNNSVYIDDPNDDTGMNSITLEKDEIMGGYSYKFNYKSYDPITNKYVKKEYIDRNITSGAQLEYVRSLAPMKWVENDELNNELYRNR